LAIETSCDETAIAVLEINSKPKILSNIIASQVKIHQKYGGVFPALAKREHQKNLLPVLTKSLKTAKMLKAQSVKRETKNNNLKRKTLQKILEREPNLSKNIEKFLNQYEKPKIDAIAITVGPGLEPCLWTGVNFAKALSSWWNLSLIPVNHLEAHIAANWLEKNPDTKNLFPTICLVVSGGHTQLILMKDFGHYKIIGETRDDAAGECFDKTARVLGLPYPGGPAISKLAEQAQSPSQKDFKINLSRPMINEKNYDFSFSGLKTAVLYDYQKRSAKTKKSAFYLKAISKEIQEAIIDVLIKKTIRAAKDYRAKTIMLGGGVTANNRLRQKFLEETEKKKIEIFIPQPEFSTDNAAMIAVAAYFGIKKKKGWQDIKADANLRI